VQDLRGLLHLRARPTEEPVRGLRGLLHLRAQQAQEQLQDMQRRSTIKPEFDLLDRARILSQRRRHRRDFMIQRRSTENTIMHRNTATEQDRSDIGVRATTLSSQTTGQRPGSVHLVEKLCSVFLLDIKNHSWRASGQEGPRGIGSGCEAHSARTRHITNCIKQGYKTSGKAPAGKAPEHARVHGSVPQLPLSTFNSCLVSRNPCPTSISTSSSSSFSPLSREYKGVDEGEMEGLTAG